MDYINIIPIHPVEMPEDFDPLKTDTKVTAALKYAVGCIWNLPFKMQRKMELDFFLQM